MMRRLTRAATALLIPSLVCIGCSDVLRIRSTPPGAAVQMDGRPIGYTPTQYSIGRFETWPNQVRFERQGYRPMTVPLKTERAIGRVIAFGWLFRPTRVPDYPDGTLSVDLEPDESRPVAAVPNSTAPVEVRLKEVQRLYDSGLINKEEYEAQRAKVLRDL